MRPPPSVVVEIKALACELPHRHDLPLSRFSLAEIQNCGMEYLERRARAPVEGGRQRGSRRTAIDREVSAIRPTQRSAQPYLRDSSPRMSA